MLESFQSWIVIVIIEIILETGPVIIITDLFQMSIEIKQQLALHLYSFRNVNMKQQGNYLIRFHIYSEKQHPNDEINFLLPTSIISDEKNITREKQKPKYRKIGAINDTSYTSPYIPIKYSEEKSIINQICLFRNSHIIDIGQDYRNMKLTLYCQLLLLQSFSEQQYIKCAEFQAEIKGSSITQYLEITFDGKYACTIEGMIRSIVYKTQFRNNEQIVKKHIQQNQKADHITKKGDLREIKNIVRSLDQYIKVAGREKAKNALDFYLAIVDENCKSLEQQFKQFLYQIAYQHCQKVFQKQQFQNFGTSLKIQRQKMKIFENSSLKNFQGLMHKAANRIYPIWGCYIRLISKIGQVIIPLLKQEYRQKIQQKWGESIVRHQVKVLDWSVQKYNTGQEHLMMSKKLRKCDQSFESDNIYFLDKNMFPPQHTKSILFDQVYCRPLISGEQRQFSKKKKHLIIFVHGLGACRYDMQKLAIQMKRQYINIEPLISMSNEGRTEGDINEMGERLARETINFIQHMSQQPSKISFIGHSMGGVIIRSALSRLYKFSPIFHTFMTLSSPHVGYLYNSSTLIDAGLWIINNVQKCKSTQQLTMSDSAKLEDTFMYKLSQQEGMQWFKEVILVSSYQDAYIPYDSARIQKNSSTLNDKKNNTEKGRVYCKMVDNIINKIRAQKLHRMDINLEIPEKNVDNFIGRAAHIKFLNCKELLKMITTSCQPLFN